MDKTFLDLDSVSSDAFHSMRFTSTSMSIGCSLFSIDYRVRVAGITPSGGLSRSCVSRLPPSPRVCGKQVSCGAWSMSLAGEVVGARRSVCRIARGHLRSFASRFLRWLHAVAVAAAGSCAGN